MVPTFFMILSDLPLNENGKIDRSKLPKPTFDIHYRQQSHVSPTNRLEDIVHGIWCEILKLEQISIKKNLFALGGNSLQFVRIFNQYQLVFSQHHIDLHHLLYKPTIEEHALYLESFQTVNDIDEIHSTINAHYNVWTSFNVEQGKENNRVKMFFA